MVRERGWKRWLWMSMFAVFSAGGLAWVLDDGAGLGWRLIGVGMLVLGPFGVAQMASRALFHRDRPFLTLTEQGFTYEGMGAFGFVAWNDVTELRTSGFGYGTTMVVGRVRNPAALDDQRTPFWRWSARRQRMWGDFVMHDLTLGITAKQLFKLMSDYWPPKT